MQLTRRRSTSQGCAGAVQSHTHGKNTARQGPLSVWLTLHSGTILHCTKWYFAFLQLAQAPKTPSRARRWPFSLATIQGQLCQACAEFMWLRSIVSGFAAAPVAGLPPSLAGSSAVTATDGELQPHQFKQPVQQLNHTHPQLMLHRQTIGCNAADCWLGRTGWPSCLQ